MEISGTHPYRNVLQSVKHGKVHLRPYVDLILLCIIMPENRNCLTTFGESFSYGISTEAVKGFTDCMEQSICHLM
jgi:hypothetical protein